MGNPIIFSTDSSPVSGSGGTNKIQWEHPLLCQHPDVVGVRAEHCPFLKSWLWRKVTPANFAQSKLPVIFSCMPISERNRDPQRQWSEGEGRLCSFPVLGKQCCGLRWGRWGVFEHTPLSFIPWWRWHNIWIMLGWGVAVLPNLVFKLQNNLYWSLF